MSVPTDSTCQTGRARKVFTGDPQIDASMDFLDERADAWMQESHIVSATHAMCTVFASVANREMLERFRKMLEAHLHLSFVEGAYFAWDEIAAQQKALGHPLPSFGTEPTQ